MHRAGRNHDSLRCARAARGENGISDVFGTYRRGFAIPDVGQSSDRSYVRSMGEGIGGFRIGSENWFMEVGQDARRQHRDATIIDDQSIWFAELENPFETVF